MQDKGKSKVVPVLKTGHHAMKAYWVMQVFLTLALDGGELSASRSGRLTSTEKAPVTH
jgi:hypothetical protein